MRRFFIPALILVLGLALGSITTLHLTKGTTILAEQTRTDLGFLNRAVTENIGKHFIINFKPLKTLFKDIQDRYPHKTYVYFSYLNNASWVGINEREEFTAASTIKVPIAMTLLKAVENKKVNLEDVYALESVDLDEHFGDLYKEGVGREHTVRDLMSIMLKYSDNTALNGLTGVFRRIGIDDPLADVYGTLGWEIDQQLPEFGQAPDYSKINLKTLANLFIALYDAKYVSPEHSNLILSLLAETPFSEKIVAGVPSGIVVSHKIGTAGEEDTYSDCGIVYAPSRHYLLCIGSAGADEETASRFMAEISAAAYDYVINN